MNIAILRLRVSKANPSIVGTRPSPNEPSLRSDTSLSDLLEELRRLHRVGLARESYTCSLPGYTIFEQATGGCLGTISAGITGFRHLGGTEDTDTVLGATKAKLFTVSPMPDV